MSDENTNESTVKRLCSSCGKSFDYEFEFCPNCGAMLTPNIAFCSNCGAKQGETVPKKGHGLLIFLIILLVLGGLSFVFVPKILNGEPLIPTEQQRQQEEWQKIIDEENRRYEAELEAQRQHEYELSVRQPSSRTYNNIQMLARSSKYIEIDTTDVKRIKIFAECASWGTQLKFDLLDSLEDFNDFSNVSTDGGYAHFGGFNYLGKNYMREFKCNEWEHGKNIYLVMKNRNWAFDASVTVQVICYYNDLYQ